MLSFLIPTYNFNCTSLVRSLFEQATALKKEKSQYFDFEILVADDASPCRELRDCNEEIAKWAGCRFFPLSENLGRAKIRNYLASLAQFDWLVFIDCDAEVCSPNFVRTYWEKRQQGDVVCGSLCNPEKCPRGGELRYRYEASALGKRSVKARTAHPYAYFTTFNVMFRKDVFQYLQFDERCTEYGYEDALMGLMLRQNGFHVAHIENPLIHNGIDMNEVYLAKVETSLRVLYRLGEPLHSASALVRLEKRLKHCGLLGIVRYIYTHFSSGIRRNLSGRHPSLLLLNLYKLGYYSAIANL